MRTASRDADSIGFYRGCFFSMAQTSLNRHTLVEPYNFGSLRVEPSTSSRSDRKQIPERQTPQ